MRGGERAGDYRTLQKPLSLENPGPGVNIMMMIHRISAKSGQCRGNAGFTLLEVVVAMTILAGGLIAIMRFFPTAIQQSRIASEHTVIAAVAKTELSQARAIAGSELSFARSGGIGQPLQAWAERNASRDLQVEGDERAAIFTGWRSSVQRVRGDVDLFRITFSVQLFDGGEEKFVTYVTAQ